VPGSRAALTAHDLTLLLTCALFHDVGKIGIPDASLKKPGRFTDRHWAVMQAHAAKGERIMLATGLDYGETIGLAVRHHHERYDGGGCPDGAR